MNEKIGVLVGRFQTPELTDCQINVLNDFLKNDYKAYIIILGVSATKASINNPLDFDSRRRMIEDAFPKKFLFGYMKDSNNDFQWSAELRLTIDYVLHNNKSMSKYEYLPDEDIIIHGDQTGFISKYFGNCQTKEIQIEKISSMDFQKEQVSKKVKDSASWRAGACWSASNRYPVAYHTVDCAIFDDLSFNYVWMARKDGETGLRFVGGFVDPNDDSAEGAAVRESLEETGTKCSILGYISSRKIDDWRYRNEADKIITSFYALIKQNGIPKASDDICELYKVNIMTLDEKNVMPEHRQLLADVKNWVNTKQIFKEHKM